jgi:hypothetical protein
MLGDALMVSLLAVALHLSASGRGKAFAWACAALSLAILQKETALLAVPVLWYSRKGARSDRLALGAAILVPFLWWSYVWLAAPETNVSVVAANFSWPASGFLGSLQHALQSDRGAARLLKDLSLLGLHGLAVVLLAVMSLAGSIRFGELQPRLRGLAVSGGLYSVMGVLLAVSIWSEPWAYARALLPLFVLLFFFDIEQMELVEGRGPRWWGRALLFADAVAGLAFLAKDLLLKTP